MYLKADTSKKDLPDDNTKKIKETLIRQFGHPIESDHIEGMKHYEKFLRWRRSDVNINMSISHIIKSKPNPSTFFSIYDNGIDNKIRNEKRQTSTPSTKAKSLAEGFNNIPWGAKPKDVKGLRKFTRAKSFYNIISSGDVPYIHRSEDLVFGDAKLSNITYFFNDHYGFYYAAFVINPSEIKDPADNSQKLKEILINFLGEPESEQREETNEEITHSFFWWIWSEVLIQLTFYWNNERDTNPTVWGTISDVNALSAIVEKNKTDKDHTKQQ